MKDCLTRIDYSIYSRGEEDYFADKTQNEPIFVINWQRKGIIVLYLLLGPKKNVAKLFLNDIGRNKAKASVSKGLH